MVGSCFRILSVIHVSKKKKKKKRKKKNIQAFKAVIGLEHIQFAGVYVHVHAIISPKKVFKKKKKKKVTGCRVKETQAHEEYII